MSARFPAIARLAHRARTEAGAFGAWWIQELREAVAALGESLGSRSAVRFVVEIDGDHAVLRRVGRSASSEEEKRFPVGSNGEFPDAAQVWPDGAPANARAEVVLPPNATLLCPLSLPPVSDRDLPAVVDLQLERKLPLSRDRLYLDWHPTNKASDGPRSVLAVVAHRSFVESLRAGITAWGWRLTAVRPSESLPNFNLLPERSHALRHSFSQRDRQLTVSALALVCCYGFVVAGQWLYERLGVEDAVLEGESKIATVSKLQRDLDQMSQPVMALRRVMATPSAGDTLLAVGASIPSDAWLYQAEIHAGARESVLELEGFAPSPAVLVESLEHSAHFHSVTLVEAGSNEVGSSIQRFKVTARTRAEGSP